MLQDIVAIIFLVFLEGLLSFDNALALAAMVRHLPAQQQKKALYYGMFGAFLFRFLALWFVVFLMENVWVKFIGGGYLLYLSAQFFFSDEDDEDPWKRVGKGLLGTIIYVELTDIAFSVDSILAAVAVSEKVWVVVTGGIFGIIMMRFAASAFIKLIAKYPNLERSAFLLVGTVGTKLIIEGFKIPWVDFHNWSTATPYILWGIMAMALATGFIND